MAVGPMRREMRTAMRKGAESKVVLPTAVKEREGGTGTCDGECVTCDDIAGSGTTEEEGVQGEERRLGEEEGD